MDLLNPPRLDKASIKKFFNRAAKTYDSSAILQEEILTRLIDRLQYIVIQPRTVIDIGCGTGKGVALLQKVYPRARVYGVDMAYQMLDRARSRFRFLSRQRLVAADMEHLPFKAMSFDLVLSSLALQWSNDYRQTLAGLAGLGKPGGLLMFASFGPGTLVEMSRSWEVIDPYPHVHRFVDMHDVGDALMTAGLSLPVVDAETIRMEYTSFRGLLDDLKNIGATNADKGRRRGLTTPATLRRLEEAYREQGFEDGKFIASYEVVYGHAWIQSNPGGR